MHPTKNTMDSNSGTKMFSSSKTPSYLKEKSCSSNILPYSKHCKRILVIDNDADLTNAVLSFIQSFHHNIICDVATEPYEALLMLSDAKYDMVIIDKKIPYLYGTDFLKKMDNFIDQDPLIVESGRYDQIIPIVLMSGSKAKLPHDFKLNNFYLETVIQKQTITDFLTSRFVN